MVQYEMFYGRRCPRVIPDNDQLGDYVDSHHSPFGVIDLGLCGGKAAGLWLPGGRVLLAGVALPRQHAAAQQGAADDRAGEERMPTAHQNAVV
jgi:hypothetical protein